LIKNFLKIDPNFSLTIKIFNKLKIDYWICQGTLLGIIRNKYLIPWDPDIDFAVIEKKINKSLFEIEMKKNGFKKKRKFFKNDNLITFSKKAGRDVDINFYKINSQTKTVYVQWYVPKNMLMRLIEVFSFSKTYKGNRSQIVNFFSFSQSFFKLIKKNLIKKDLFYKRAGYSHPYRFISRFTKINFFDLKIVVPFFYIDYLNHIYGKNWKKPIKVFSWVKDSPSTKYLN
jgi:phosphorylcholine metabolism protein LicD